MFDASDWELTSMMGFSVSAGSPAKLGPLGFGPQLIPVEFTNTQTGMVRKFGLAGISASVSGKTGGGGKAPAPAPKKFRFGGLSFPIMPSLPTVGSKVRKLGMAKEPFDIDQGRGRCGGMVAGGLNLGFTGTTGLLVFTFVPPVGVLLSTAALATSIAMCAFATTGTAIGGLGATAEQFLFFVG